MYLGFMELHVHTEYIHLDIPDKYYMLQIDCRWHFLCTLEYNNLVTNFKFLGMC